MSYRRARTTLMSMLAVLALAVTLLMVPTGPAQAAATGTVAGTVTAWDLDLEGTVDFFPVTSTSANPVSSTTFQADGVYSKDLPAGQYRVRFRSTNPYDGGYGLAPIWAGGSPTRYGATAITVTAGQVRTVNADLPEGGMISGTVAQASGSTDIAVTVYMADPGFPGGFNQVGAGKVPFGTVNYEVPGLAPGKYKLYFYLQNSRREGWWQNASSLASATPVTVGGPATITENISPTNLSPFGTVSGKVTAAVTGLPVEGIIVTLLRPDGSEVEPAGATAADGTYSIDAAAGAYSIRFFATDDTFLRTEFWKESPQLVDRKNFTVTSGNPTPNINAALEPKATSLINTGVPVITGTRKVGATLVATPGKWEPIDYLSFTYQWLRGGVAIPGAVTDTYVPLITDAGKRISVRVTADRSPELLPATSDPATILFSTLALSTAAKVTGTLKVGKTLRATPPRSAPASTVTYQWLRNGKPIAGARKATYKLVKADKRKKVGVRITLTKPGYTTVVRTVTKATKVR